MMYHQQQQQQFGRQVAHQAAQPVRQTKEEGTCCNPRLLLIFSIILLTVGGIISYTGIFGPYLIWYDFGFGTAHIGFYTGCVASSVVNTISCGSLIDSDQEDWLWACQALGWVASFTAFIGWIMLLVWLCQSNKSSCLKFTILGFICVTMVSYAVGLIIFAVKYKDIKLWELYDFTWGFFIAWAGTGMILVSGILLIFHPAGPQYQTAGMMYMGQPMGQSMMTGHPAMAYQQQQAQQLPMKQMYSQSQLNNQAYSQAYSNPSQAYPPGYNTGYTGYR